MIDPESWDIFVSDDNDESLVEFNCFETVPIPKPPQPTIHSPQEYRDIYLRHPWWLRRRITALNKASNRCEWSATGDRCVERKDLQVHHLSYARLYGELDSDLQVLCRLHHLVAETMKIKCPGCQKLLLCSPEMTELFVERNLGFLGIFGEDSMGMIRAALPKQCAICRDPNTQALKAVQHISNVQTLKNMLSGFKTGNL